MTILTAWLFSIMLFTLPVSEADASIKDVPDAGERQTSATEGTGLFLADPALGLYYTRNSVCGVAATYHALSEIGRKVPLTELARDLEVTPKGNSVMQMCQTLSQLGVSHRVFKTDSFDLIAGLVTPRKRVAILHLDRPAHFVTLKRTTDGHLAILDGPDVICGEIGKVISSRFSGVAIVIGGGIPRRSIRPLSGSMAIVLSMTVLAGVAWGAWVRRHKSV